jgi:N6-adenosine-specific RNA methylase IME4
VYNSKKAALSDSQKGRFLMSYRQGKKYMAIAKRPNSAKLNAIDTGCVNINDTSKLCSNTTDEEEAAASEKLFDKKDKNEIVKAIQNLTPEMIDGKYRVIYADPPWSYGDKRGGADSQTGDAYTGATRHYTDMSIDELCEMPIENLAQDNAVLFMWTTSPLLLECMPVIEAWGFKYKASIVWDKDAHNVGHYVSVRHEILMICTKGSCTRDCVELLPSVVKIKKSRKHSEKPEQFRDMIDTMYSQGSRIELFRRGDVPEGWHVWGNEAEICASMAVEA